MALFKILQRCRWAPLSALMSPVGELRGAVGGNSYVSLFFSTIPDTLVCLAAASECGGSPAGEHHIWVVSLHLSMAEHQFLKSGPGGRWGLF